MSKATNIDDVAQLAGVSIKTVSRVVNREPNVRESTRLLVEQAISTLNYRPNTSARNLASQSARLIVLVYDDPSYYEAPSSGYILKLQQGTLQACKPANHELLIRPCNYRDKELGAELVSSIRQLRPSGLIIAPPLSNMKSIVNAIASTDVPFVLLSPGTKKPLGFTVRTNDREICSEMTSYLASLGHRRIAFIRGDAEHKAVAKRYLGYCDGLSRNGLSLEVGLVLNGDNSMGSGEVCARQLLAMKQPPTAVFAANDDMAVGVIKTAVSLGIAIPGQLSVVGCDDIVLARQVHPALTTIHQPLAEMAERAARLLISKTQKGEPFVGGEMIPGTIVHRDSTGPAPG
ncbi:MAG: LacI family transcriptional regulator [Halieaceae bacterium]